MNVISQFFTNLFVEIKLVYLSGKIAYYEEMLKR